MLTFILCPDSQVKILCMTNYKIIDIPENQTKPIIKKRKRIKDKESFRR